MRQYKEAGLTN